MKNVSRLVLCSLDTISVPPEGNIGGERWQRRRNENKNKQKKTTLPEPGARQRVAWPLPETHRRLPSVCLPALSCGSGWQRCWRETPGCQTLFQENLQQIQNKNRQTAGEFGSEEVQEHQPWFLSTGEVEEASSRLLQPRLFMFGRQGCRSGGGVLAKKQLATNQEVEN